MSRVGRKRIPAPREPNGRASRAEAAKTRRSPKLDTMEQPHRRGLKRGQAADQAAETALGNARLRGLITADQYEAGCRWSALVGQMFAALAAPVRVASTLGQIVAPGVGEPIGADSRGEPETEEERADRILGLTDGDRRSGGQYDRAKFAITCAYGAVIPGRYVGLEKADRCELLVFELAFHLRDVFAALDLVVVRNQPPAAAALAPLRFGLDALVEHWHIGERPRPMRAMMVDGARPAA